MRGLAQWLLTRKVRRLVGQINAGKLSINEARAQLGLKPWNLGSP